MSIPLLGPQSLLSPCGVLPESIKWVPFAFKMAGKGGYIAIGNLVLKFTMDLRRFPAADPLANLTNQTYI